MEKNSYHHENLRQELVEAGVRLVTQEGTEALSLRRLAAECGVSHAAPYKHFQNKEDILQAVTDRVYALFTEEMMKTLDNTPGDDPRRRLIQLGKCYVCFSLENPEFLKLMFFHSGRRQATAKKMRLNGERVGDAFAVFRDTAIAYLQAIRAPAGEYETRIVSMWSLVHGLTLLLANQNWVPGIPTAQAVEQVLEASC